MRVLFIYQKPDLAWAAVTSMLFVIVMNVLPMDHVDKFSYQMAMGLSVYFLVISGKATRNRYRNLAVLMFTVALIMAVIGVVYTSPETLEASALEDMSNPLIGGMGGFFTEVEDEGRPVN